MGQEGGPMTQPGAAFDHVMRALDQSQRRFKVDKPNHIQASCPGPIHKNGDRTPSLSITAIEGQVLMHCQSGDPIEVVLDALGLRPGDLFDDGDEIPGLPFFIAHER